jgi:hypothetical protein
MPGQHVYWVQKQIVVQGEPRAFIVVFECAATSVEALAADLAAAVVAGNRLRTVEDGRGGMLIRSREPYAMGAAGTVAIRDYPHPIWEPEDAPAGAGAE